MLELFGVIGTLMISEERISRSPHCKQSVNASRCLIAKLAQPLFN